MVNFNLMDDGYIVRSQSGLESTKESVLPVCDNPGHTVKGILQKLGEIETTAEL